MAHKPTSNLQSQQYNESHPMYEPISYPMNPAQCQPPPYNPSFGQPAMLNQPNIYPVAQPSYPTGFHQPVYPPGLHQPVYPPGLHQPGLPNHPQGYGMPVMQQPAPSTAPGGWMNMPSAPANCPPGLEYLTQINTLIVHQQVEVMELLTSFETNNKYIVKNSLLQNVYLAAEDNDCCTRYCCGSLRPFDMRILDNYGNEVINLKRPLACDSCCYPCCLQTLEVCSPPGTRIGSVEQKWSIFKPQFEVKDAVGEVVLEIVGPCIKLGCCSDINFKIYSKTDGRKLGKISKQWSGMIQELSTDADNFSITFPMDLDAKIKAVLLGALFLIDFMFFETGSSRH